MLQIRGAWIVWQRTLRNHHTSASIGAIFKDSVFFEVLNHRSGPDCFDHLAAYNSRLVPLNPYVQILLQIQPDRLTIAVTICGSICWTQTFRQFSRSSQRRVRLYCCHTDNLSWRGAVLQSKMILSFENMLTSHWMVPCVACDWWSVRAMMISRQTVAFFVWKFSCLARASPTPSE